MGIRVLHIEDDAVTRYTRERVLRRADFEVFQAATGEEGLKLIPEVHPHVVLLDVHLPDAHGFELCRRIKSDPGTASIQVLHITASAMSIYDLAQGLESADGYLVEPVEPAVLIAHIRALARTHSALSELGQMRMQTQALAAERDRLMAAAASGGAGGEIGGSRELLGLAVDAADLGVWEMDVESGAVSASERLCRVFGFETAPASAEEWAARVHPEDLEHVRGVVQTALLGRTRCALQCRVLHPEGVRRVGAKLTITGGAGMRARLVAFVHDDTAGAAGAEALRESEERYRRIVEGTHEGEDHERHLANTPVMVVEYGPDLRITRWSSMCERVFGWTSAEVVGKHLSEIRWVHDDDAEGVQRVVEGMIAGSHAHNINFNRNYTKDGRIVYCEWYNSVLHDESGRLRSVLCFGLDATERKRMEEELRQAQRAESIGVLAGGIAHDFNNLLTGVVGNASLALETLDPAGFEYAAVERVLKAGQKAAELTRQLLAYAGKGRWVIRRVNVSVLVREIVGLMRASLPATAEIVLELAPDVPEIEADAGQIEQVAVNLLLNASDAIGRSAGLIRIATSAVDIDPAQAARKSGALAPGAYLLLRITDTGCGIAPEILPHIFEPFFTTKFTGRGLGLAAVQGIVRAHRGAIEVESEPGKGSTFRVYFPVARQAAAGASNH